MRMVCCQTPCAVLEDHEPALHTYGLGEVAALWFHSKACRLLLFPEILEPEH